MKKQLTLALVAASVFGIAGCPSVPEEGVGGAIGKEVSDAAPGISDFIRVVGAAGIGVGRETADAGIEYYNENLFPRPVAGANKTIVYEGELVILKLSINEALRSPGASHVSDPAFDWVQLAGPKVQFEQEPHAPRLAFFAPSVDSNQQLLFEATATLPNGNSERAEIEVIVLNLDPAANAAPIANAGDNRSANSGSNVTLVGDRSRDPEGEELLYEWKQFEGPEVELRYADESSTIFTAPKVKLQTRLRFRLTVTDDAANSDSSIVVVTVHP